MSDAKSDWWKSTFGDTLGGTMEKGVDWVENKASAIKQDAATVIDKGEDLAKKAVGEIKDDVNKAEDWAKGEVNKADDWAKDKAAGVAAAVKKEVGDLKLKAVGDQSGKAVPRPMEAGCTPVHGQVPGPKNHLFCSSHGHVVDTDRKMIIADSVASYVKDGVAKAVLPNPEDIKKDAEDAKKKIEDKAQEVEKDVDEGIDKTIEIAKRLEKAGEDLLVKAKDLGVAVSDYIDGCEFNAAAVFAAIGAFGGSLAAAGVGTAATPTPAAPVAAPVAGTAILGAILSGVGIIAAVAAFIDCKRKKLEDAQKRAAQARQDAQRQAEVDKIKKQVDDLQKRSDDLKKSFDDAKQIAH